MTQIADAKRDPLAPLADILDRLAAELGMPESEPTALEGGITNRNYRTRLGGREVVIRLPGKDTELLGHYVPADTFVSVSPWFTSACSSSDEISSGRCCINPSMPIPPPSGPHGPRPCPPRAAPGSWPASCRSGCG